MVLSRSGRELPAAAANKQPERVSAEDLLVGQILLKIINDDLTLNQVHEALTVQEKEKLLKKKIGQILVELGYVTRKEVDIALRMQRALKIRVKDIQSL